MKKEIIDQMAKIVQDTMTMFQSDFTEHDLKNLDNYNDKFIWQVASSHTHLHLCGADFLDKTLESEASLYDFCQNHTWAGACIEGATSDDKFYIYDDDTDEFRECSKDEAKAKWETARQAALNRWVIYNDTPLPTDFKMRIEFGSNETRRYFIEQLRFARQHNDKSLFDCVRRFRNYRKYGACHKIVIGRDFADRSFTFHEDYGNGRYGLNGGIIFHGYPQEGYRVNDSVQLTPSYGWSIHT